MDNWWPPHQAQAQAQAQFVKQRVIYSINQYLRQMPMIQSQPQAQPQVQTWPQPQQQYQMMVMPTGQQILVPGVFVPDQQHVPVLAQSQSMSQPQGFNIPAQQPMMSSPAPP